eukprot:TRINITY_DN21627_c0_g1_i1.p1 TRINITY_DN21627_c0_g1~~TRINITY_DN21627_c0_g1_i1.p1  ORF type:complete len:226 (+),score=30.90 TRINITY_DN21627_c0_g1_i1:2-679(+)
MFILFSNATNMSCNQQVRTPWNSTKSSPTDGRQTFLIPTRISMTPPCAILSWKPPCRLPASTCNPGRWSYSGTPKKKQALRKLASDQPKVSEAPVVLMILGDRDGWKEGNQTFETLFATTMIPEQRDWFVNATKALYGSSEPFSQAFANKNAGLFAMSLMYAASDKGLHTHPMDGFDHDGVKKAFDIPDNYWISMLIAVGHAKPGLEIHPKAWRQSFEEMVLKTY